jgi:hypothetical protein
MQKITSGAECVRESSLVFKEQNYGQRRWQVDMPTNGLANLFPFFAFNTHIEEDISKIPQTVEIE